MQISVSTDFELLKLSKDLGFGRHSFCEKDLRVVNLRIELNNKNICFMDTLAEDFSNLVLGIIFF